MIEAVIVQAGCGAARTRCSARGDVAPAIVAGSVGLRFATGCGASGSGGIEAGQLVRLARVAGEILVGTRAVVGTLPQLAQVGVDILIAVRSPTERVGGRS